MLVFMTGCEDEEVRDIAKAQECMDAVPASSPQDASNCFAYVEKHTSQQANILKCAIKLTSGGLSSQKMVEAYKAAGNSNLTSKESVYFAYLSLDLPTQSGGYDIAVEAYPYCVKSEVSGMVFIAGLAKTASLVTKSGVTIDLNDPATTEANIKTALQNCISTCTAAELADTGATIVNLATTYCKDSSSDQGVCTDVKNSVNQYGGNTEQAGKAFMCILQDKTFDGTSCT
tara:strand:- start:668 stop:1357 length:690 start_codon:yes stop_codon:yes gene_type:complete